MSKRKQFKLDPNVVRALTSPHASTNGQRHRASYDLKPETIEAIKIIAGELDVNIYSVTQKLLDYAIQEYKEGRLELKRKPVITAWELE